MIPQVIRYQQEVRQSKHVTYCAFRHGLLVDETATKLLIILVDVSVRVQELPKRELKYMTVLEKPTVRAAAKLLLKHAKMMHTKPSKRAKRYLKTLAQEKGKKRPGVFPPRGRSPRSLILTQTFECASFYPRSVTRCDYQAIGGAA